MVFIFSIVFNAILAFVVLGLFFSVRSQEVAGKNVSKRPIMCRVGRKTFTQSIQSGKSWMDISL